MAERIVRTCDVCGKEPADVEAFGFKGKSYEVDLCQKDADAFANALTGYVDKARTVVGTSTRPDLPTPAVRRSRGTRANAAAPVLAFIRDKGKNSNDAKAWAVEGGWKDSKGNVPVVGVGRASTELLEAYAKHLGYTEAPAAEFSG